MQCSAAADDDDGEESNDDDGGDANVAGWWWKHCNTLYCSSSYNVMLVWHLFSDADEGDDLDDNAEDEGHVSCMKM